MHFIITALGSYGDVHPMIGLGAGLLARGHQVQLVASPYFQEEARRAGLEVLTLGTEEDYLNLTRRPDLWHPRKSLSVVLKQASVQFLEPLYRTIHENVRAGETIIAAHGLDMASRIAREALRVPVAAVVLAPMALWCDREPARLPIGMFSPRYPAWWNRAQFELGERFSLRPLVMPEINRVRRLAGLPKLRRGVFHWLYEVDLTLCLFPEWFAPIAPGWPRQTRCVGFPLWDGSAHRELSEPCKEFLAGGDPPIVFTPGSANRHSADYLQHAAETCEWLDQRGILLTKFDEQLPRDLPERVVRFAFEPLTRLLPSAAALVHHGGIGTSSQALAAGVPQLVRPLAFDQLDNAARLRRLGVAAELSPRKFTAKSASRELYCLLHSERTQEACQRAAAMCDGAAARGRACDALESLA